MTRRQYLDALKKLSLTPASKQTAALLGVTVRQCQRLASGAQQPTETIALLLAMYLKHGI